MGTVVAQVLDLISKSFKYVVWLCVASGLLLFLPSSWLKALRADQFVEDYGHWIGPLFIISCALIVINLLHCVWTWLQARWLKQKTIRELKELTPHEKNLLMEYIEAQKQTVTFSLFDGEMFGLVDKGILYKPDSLSNQGGQQDFNMYPWVFRYLSQHRDILSVTPTNPVESDSISQSK